MEEKVTNQEINNLLLKQKKSLEKTGKKLMIFWFIIGLLIGILIF